MKNIHLIPTDKPSRLRINSKGKLILSTIPVGSKGETQNIYITNSERPKIGDWVIVNKKYIRKVDITFNKQDSDWNVLNTNKIILTTDQDLIKDGVQAIDDEFLEWFVKNPSCESVEVEKQMLCDYCGQEHCDNLRCKGYKDSVWYKIIIPQEEPKQEIVGYRLNSHIDRNMVDNILKNAMPIWNDADKSVYFIRGHVAGSLVARMKELQVLDLWFIPIYEDEEIKSDWVKENHLEYYYKEGIMKEEPKQETLEEAAEDYAVQYLIEDK